MDDLYTLHPHGLFLRGEAVERGYDDRDLARACASKELVRVRYGTYMPGTGWPDDALHRHRLRAQAVMLRHPRRAALSHTTGAVVHGLRLWDPDLDSIHLTRLIGHNGRSESDVQYHRDRYDESTLVLVEEMLLLDEISCALGAAAITTVEKGLVILDSLLELDADHVTALPRAYAALRRTPHTRGLRIAVSLARRGSQSVGESRMSFFFWEQHLPRPQLQYEVYDGVRLVGICDFAWPELGLLGEFDGKVKYRRFVRPGEDPADVVFREKRREDELREVTGWRMIRYTYADLYSRARTAERTRRMMDRRTASATVGV